VVLSAREALLPCPDIFFNVRYSARRPKIAGLDDFFAKVCTLAVDKRRKESKLTQQWVFKMAINSVHIASQQASGGARTKAAENTSVSTAGNQSAQQAASKGTHDAATVKLSDTAQSIKNAERKMADTPDVDQSKVDRLKAAIESGNYSVNAERTAAGMMDMDGLLG